MVAVGQHRDALLLTLRTDRAGDLDPSAGNHVEPIALVAFVAVTALVELPGKLTAGSTGGHILFGMSGSMVNDALVNGSWVMRDRAITTLDEAEVHARSRAAAPRIWAQM